MKLPLQITTRNISLSEAAENTIREKAAKLETFHDNITACRVLVEVPHRHKHQGMSYHRQPRHHGPGQRDRRQA
jgi:ribosome-associated translation inhibitor RaiA